MLCEFNTGKFFGTQALSELRYCFILHDRFSVFLKGRWAEFYHFSQ
jgi:hypothetical protein